MRKPNRTLITTYLVTIWFILMAFIPICRAEISIWWVKGEAWNKLLTVSEKEYYIQGLLDGLVASEKFKHDTSYSTTIENYRKGMDEFYKDYRNELVPAFFALRIVSLGLKGIPQQQIEQELRNLRSKFHKIEEERKK